MRALGIDIGGTSVKAALIDGEAAHTARSAGYVRPGRAQLVRAIRCAVAELGDAIGASIPVGLCVPGRRSVDGCCVERSLNLPCLEGWSFDELLREVLGDAPGRLRVVSDIHAATVDVVRSMELRGRAAVVAIGTGVGLGVWEDDRMLSIGGRGIGHLGQVDVGRLGDTDRYGADGARNTLESYVGLPALRSVLGDPDEAGLAGRIASLGIDDPAMLALVRALRMVHALYVPDTVVIAGGVGIAMAPMGGLLHDRVSDGLTSLACPGWSLRFGESLFHASLGAARLALG